MDNYDFNLDLETWGLTHKQKELKRFEGTISPADIAASNALFGYEADKYYFDVDIRRHFGLDKYDNDIIPYWKTETVEAMNAFRLKPGYDKPAGECVSLAALYVAAAFIVCQIPLEDIYMILTPLHSQNFIDIQNGVLTNNRRLVTKTMWFNGTAISNKAQRALRNEQITILAHCSGYVHQVYNEATMDKRAYEHFTSRLADYLCTDLTGLVFANFLRAKRYYQQYFQFCTESRGNRKYIKAEVLFHYEHTSNHRIASSGYDKLLAEVSSEDYLPYKYSDRMCCETFASFVEYENIDIVSAAGREKLSSYLKPFVPDADRFVAELADFLRLQVKLPGPDKNFVAAGPIEISPEKTRTEIIEYLKSIRKSNTTADLAFYAYRDVQSCDWLAFAKAALERNPVSLQAGPDKSLDEVYKWLNSMAAVSIYPDSRLAQPDEVVNYQTGDGLEKAFALANIIRDRDADQEVQIIADDKDVIVKARSEFCFSSAKALKNELTISPGPIRADSD